MSTYPESEKLAQLQDEIDAIEAFLEETGALLYQRNNDGDPVPVDDLDAFVASVRGVDMKQVDVERAQMLRELAAANREGR